jgi:hypothetical protein
VGHHKRCPFCSSLETQSECCGERSAVIPSNTPGEPVVLNIIEVNDVDHRIIYETTPHSARRIRLALDLFKPQCRFDRWIGWAEVGDHMREARVVDGEQYGSIFVLDESLYVAIHLHYHASVV